jgi:hypothetical protein
VAPFEFEGGPFRFLYKSMGTETPSGGLINRPRELYKTGHSPRGSGLAPHPPMTLDRGRDHRPTRTNLYG